MPFTFDTLRMNANGSYPTGFGKLALKLEPKAIHDEMNSAAFDEFGRMTANLGLEAVPATPALQNIILYPYVNPSTELIDATNLPKNVVILDGTGRPAGDVKITPIATQDGSQIWKITHNGVDTHPIHFHLYDVQVLNRVTWDNIIIPTDPTELGWKDTVRISPLEDTIVALRPIIPSMPLELPNAVRLLNPMQPQDSTFGFNNIDAAGNPTAAITNVEVNFGWEYVYHCHILSHEEMDMMRPVSVAMPPNTPTWTAQGLPSTGNGNNATLTLTWNDNSINETQFVVQRDDGTGWVNLGTPVLQPLYQAPGCRDQQGSAQLHGHHVQPEKELQLPGGRAEHGWLHRRRRCFRDPHRSVDVGVLTGGCPDPDAQCPDQPDGGAAGRAAGQPDLEGQRH